MYGKLSVDGKLIQAPSVVEYHSRKYVNPSSDILLALGYLPVIDDPETKPQAGQDKNDYVVSSYKYNDGHTAILKVYKKKPITLTNENYETYVQEYVTHNAESIKGDDGKSAYELAVEQGYNGTLAEWLISLKGKDGVVSGDGTVIVNNKVPVSLSAVKTKTTYAQNETISLADLVVTVTYDDDTSEVTTNYNTNINDIDTFTAGLKKLVISYYDNGKCVSTTIPITVSFDESYDKIQYSYKLTNAGAIKSSVPLLGYAKSVVQYSNLNLKLKIKLTIEQNERAASTTFKVVNTNFTDGALGSVVIPAKTIGEYELVVDYTFEYENSNIVASSDVILATLTHNGGSYISGMFEIIDASLALTDAVIVAPSTITAVKTNKYFIRGEECEFTDVIATVTYNYNKANYNPTPQELVYTNIDNNVLGDQNLYVGYTENTKTVQTTTPIVLHIFDNEKTVADQFVVKTADEWYNSWKYGINLGNAFDPWIASYFDTTDVDDRYVESQQTLWGVPKITQQNIQEIVDAGFECVRIPITWLPNSRIDDESHYHIGKWWTYRIQEILSWCINAGLYVIINTHHDSQPLFDMGVDEDIFLEHLENARQFWTQIAEKFKYYDHHLVFEGFNEIDNEDNSWVASTEAQIQMNSLNQVFVDSVRGTGANNTNRVLICPFLIHRYSPLCADAYVCPTDPSEPNENASVSRYIGTAVHWYPNTWNQSIEGMLSLIEGFQAQVDIPIMVNEYGLMIKDKNANHANRVKYYANFVGRAKQHNIKSVAWDNSGDMAVVTKYNAPKSIQTNYPLSKVQSKEITDAMANAYNNDSAICVPKTQCYIYDSMEHLTAGEWNKDFTAIKPPTWTRMITDPIECHKGQKVSMITNPTSAYASIRELFIAEIVFFDDHDRKVARSAGGYSIKSKTVTVNDKHTAYARVTFYVAADEPVLYKAEDMQRLMFDEGDNMCVIVMSDNDEQFQPLEDRVPTSIKSITLLNEPQFSSSGEVIVAPIYKLQICYDEFTTVNYYSYSHHNIGTAELVIPTMTEDGVYNVGVRYTYNNTTLELADTGMTIKHGDYAQGLNVELNPSEYDIDNYNSVTELREAIYNNLIVELIYENNNVNIKNDEHCAINLGMITREAFPQTFTITYDNDALDEHYSETVNVSLISTSNSYYIAPTYSLVTGSAWAYDVGELSYNTYTKILPRQWSTKVMDMSQSQTFGAFMLESNPNETYLYTGYIVYNTEDNKYYIYTDIVKDGKGIQSMPRVALTMADAPIALEGQTATPINKPIGGNYNTAEYSSYKDSKNRKWFDLSLNLPSLAENDTLTNVCKGIYSVNSLSELDNIE